MAYRTLGPSAESDDAVQVAWLRLSRSDTRGVENLRRVVYDLRIAGGKVVGIEMIADPERLGRLEPEVD